jgi:hypothetical protein
MSLYCFGKLILASGYAVGSIQIPHVILGQIDPDDVPNLDEQLSGQGEYFSVRDDDGAVAATALWNEAAERPNLLSTRFGTAIHSLMFSPMLQSGAIAFVDGGIETVLRGTSDQCWQWFSERIILPWDNIDNPLLIWGAHD